METHLIGRLIILQIVVHSAALMLTKVFQEKISLDRVESHVPHLDYNPHWVTIPPIGYHIQIGFELPVAWILHVGGEVAALEVSVWRFDDLLCCIMDLFAHETENHVVFNFLFTIAWINTILIEVVRQKWSILTLILLVEIPVKPRQLSDKVGLRS